jgi:hypothetical protein
MKYRTGTLKEGESGFRSPTLTPILNFLFCCRNRAHGKSRIEKYVSFLSTGKCN